MGEKGTMDPREMTKAATSMGLEAAKAVVRMDEKLYLVVLAGSSVGKMFPLDGKLVAIGRDDAADIQILDAGVSRQHARVAAREGGIPYIEDLGSRNGTLVNGEAITEIRQLRAGDKLQIGANTVLRVSHSDEIETQFARKMYNAALRDGLTGAYNRRYLDERLVAEVSFSVRHETPFALLVLDIDHFKRINDSHGHACGDLVLKGLTDLMMRKIRAEDVLARYGGEEFVVICRETDASRAAILAERIRTAVEHHPFMAQGHELKITLSVGVADLSHATPCNGPTLLESADKALYRAKEQGRNRVIIARPNEGTPAGA